MNAVAFDCGDCIPLSDGETVQSVIADHLTWCKQCPDGKTEHEKQLDQLHVANWSARIDAALGTAKEAP